MANNTEQFRSGVTLVELMVVLVVTTILAVSLSMAISQSLCFHQRGREEAFVRESLCLVLERLASALEMANGIEDLGDGRWRASYRMEAGGVSFETNRFVHVSGTEYYATNLNAVLSIAHEGSRSDLQLSGDAKLDVFLGMIDRVSITGSGDVRTLTLNARHPVRVKAPTGEWTAAVVDIDASRPFRLWNQRPN